MISVRASLPASWGVAATVALLLAGCSEQNAYVPPPPPKVDVALPLKQDGDALPPGDRQHGGRQQHHAGGAGGGFPPGDRLQGRRRGQGGRPSSSSSSRSPTAGPRAGAGREVLGRRLGEAVASRLSSAADDPGQEGRRAPSRISTRPRRSATPTRPSRSRPTADVKQAQLNLSYTEVKAPFDGIVTARQVSIGAAGRHGRPHHAGHHRPARPDLRQLQRQRAGRAAHSRRTWPSAASPSRT